MEQTVKEVAQSVSKHATVPKPHEPVNANQKKPELCPLCGSPQTPGKLCHLFDGV